MGSNLLKLCLSLILTWGVVACELKGKPDLFGTYVADYSVAREKITLNEDGSFVQEVTFKATSKVDTTKGKWRYDDKTGYVRFSENYMNVLNGLGQLNPEYSQKLTSASLPALTYFGYVVVGSEEGVLYKKKISSK